MKLFAAFAEDNLTDLPSLCSYELMISKGNSLMFLYFIHFRLKSVSRFRVKYAHSLSSLKKKRLEHNISSFKKISLLCAAFAQILKSCVKILSLAKQKNELGFKDLTFS
jgi:hypothetical protein